MRLSLLRRGILIALLFGVHGAEAEQRVRLQLRWLHQFQFAGYYMAQAQGYYRAAGLAVDIVEGGPLVPRPVDDVLAGRAEFAVSGSGLVIEHMAGKPVVALAALMQTSPLVWIVRADSGIATPRDLIGKRVMSRPPPEGDELLAMFVQEGIDPGKLTITPTSYRLQDLVDGRTDAFNAYLSNEPYVLRQQGVPYRLINPRDYGVNFYGDVLMTRAALIDGDPEMVRAFVRASLAGWQYALEHVEETVQLIQRRYAPGKSLDHLRFEAETLKQLIMPDLVQIGHMNPGRWEFIANTYVKLGLARGELDLESFLFNANDRTNYRLAWWIGLAAAFVLLLVSLVAFHYLRGTRALRREVALREKSEHELRLSNRELERQATTDRLTGLWNRHKFEAAAASELERAERYGQPLALVICDIDHFKQINDAYGHHTGDSVLVDLARRIRLRLRHSDGAARWGGEEFALLLPSTRLDDAVALAEQQRALVADLPFATVGCVSASFGVAAMRPGDTLECLVRRTDRALYRAKAMGRNRVEVAAEAGDAAMEGELPSLVQLAWSEAYAFGAPALDAEHRALFGLTNTVIAATTLGRHQAEVLAAMQTLVAEVVAHCRREERVMAEYAYPHRERHVEDHRRVIAQAEALCAEWLAGDISVGRLVDFMAQELVARHIMADDRAFAQYLAKKGSVYG